MVAEARTLRVGLATENPYLSEQVRRVADAAGAVVVGTGSDGSAPDVWLLDPAAPRATPGEPPGWDGVPTLAVRLGDGGRAPAAGVVPGSGVVDLPLDAEPLLRYFSGLASPPRARVVGILGARGGAGASTLGAALARAAVASGVCTALADLDAFGGGIERLLGIEHEPGPRWADLRSEPAGFPAQALGHALPRWHEVRVLSGDLRGGVRAGDPGAAAVMRALRSDHDLVLLDLPRAGWGRTADGAWTGVLESVGPDVLVIVAMCDVRSAAAAATVADSLPGVDVRLVVRGPSPGGLHPEEIADAAALPLAASMPYERGGEAAAERGEAPGDRRRGVVARAAARLVGDLVPTP